MLIKPKPTTAFSLLGLFLFAPSVSIQSNEETGKWSIEVGAGAGQYEVVTRNCAGDVVSTRPVKFQTGGAVLEYDASNVRVDFFGGVTSVDAGDRDGLFVGGFAAWEGGPVGLGAGVASLPSGATPSFYLRFGKRDRVHFRTDFLSPDPTPGVTGLFRAGLGFPIDRAGALVGFSAYRGLDLDEASDWGGFFADVNVPLGGKLEGRFAGSVHFPEDYADWAVGVGLRVRQ